MFYSFESIDFFLKSIEVDIINHLYDYQLLEKLDRNAKKIIFAVFVKHITEKLKNCDDNLLLYHDYHFSSDHELFQYYNREELEKFLLKILNKLKKLTNKIVFIKKKTTLPKKSTLDELDGSVVDEIYLLKEKKSVDLKELKTFLKQHNLKDLFSSLSKKIA